ncbi:hypothetical protein M8J75_001340 [Diaphorina citri]|nr:hypothetical protein M8J75_001340 [Diaphorina citri]
MNTIFSVVFDSIKFGFEVFFLLIKSIFVVIFTMIGALFPTRRKSVNGQTVLVTGAGHGIGRELAIQLADLGCTVVCVDLNQENNAKTADQINTTHNCKKAFPFEMDVTSRDQVMATRQKIFETVGAVDILINNAGIMTPQPILTAKPDDIVAVINVNLLAHFWTVLAFLPGMVERNKGHVVGISSLAGLSGLANKSPYSASKFGVAGMMDALVEELRGPSPGVKFTTVHPYFVNTRPDLPEHLHLRMPQLEPGFAAKEIIRAMLEEQEAVSIPRHLYFFAHLLR